MLAARTARKAAATWAHDKALQKKLSDDAANLEAAAEELIPKLGARAVAGLLLPE